MAVVLGWPRAEVFDPAGTGGVVFQWFAPLFLAGALAVGAVAYAVQRAQGARPVVVAEVTA